MSIAALSKPAASSTASTALRVTTTSTTCSREPASQSIVRTPWWIALTTRSSAPTPAWFSANRPRSVCQASRKTGCARSSGNRRSSVTKTAEDFRR